MQLTPELVEKIDNNYLQALIDVLDKELMDEPTAKSATVTYLSLAPFTSFEDMKNKVQNFISTYPLFERVMAFVKGYEDEERTREIVARMHGLIKNNQIDEALQIAVKK
jgi:hypothetical protein